MVDGRTRKHSRAVLMRGTFNFNTVQEYHNSGDIMHPSHVVIMSQAALAQIQETK